ncbi:hypothetical protein KKG22_04305 [Patescibacteria group bacterium]|nr:hypothetical protein [Patescibacteria group bacterium]MBU1721422.1 hypothetical protein [Patescibacteria group bacterium]MBU1901862.1 hypothetical protein [Patescibacteria group bacterium]
MQNIQEVFARVQENKKQLKDLKASYNDALDMTSGYKEIAEELKTLREKKKQVEAQVKEQFINEFTQMEDLKIDIQSDMELISDIAMTQIMKGETVDITDKYDNQYEPIFKVSFKKMT